MPPQRVWGGYFMSSQPNDAPMLLSEFDAALFQLEQHEPQFEPLSQLPPPMARPSFPGMPFLLTACFDLPGLPSPS